MNQKSLSTVQGVGIAVVIVLLSVLALTIVPGWPEIGAWMKTDQAPAWVQAVCSIAAIVAAMLLVRHQDNRERRTRILSAADRYLEMFAPALALSQAAVTDYRALYGALFSDEFSFEIGFGHMPKGLIAESDAIAAGFAEIKPVSMPTVDSINSVRVLGRLIARAKEQLHELMDTSHRDPDRPYAIKQQQFLKILDTIHDERLKLRAELVRITDPSHLE